VPSSRRTFLWKAGAALAASVCDSPWKMRAEALGRGAGLQLYTVGEQLAQDFEGTLGAVRAIGYEEVEMAGFFGKKAGEIKMALGNAGLRCRSAHIFGDQDSLEETMGFAKELGAGYIVSSTVMPKLSAARRSGKFEGMTFSEAAEGLQLDDYKRVAEYCNSMGEQVQKEGLQFAYHNHNWEFAAWDGGTGYDELLRLCDPKLVKFELDCGWMVCAGRNPGSYLEKYPERYCLLHVKDFKPGRGPSFRVEAGARPAATELGRGQIDYRPIFEAARRSAVEWYFVEQEPPFVEMPVLEALKVNYAYLHKLRN
jgi:sugar phosphate isomerase/epimerase